MSHECMLCYENEPYIAIGECSHTPICYKCSYKMRLISRNISCPICKTESKIVVITDRLTDWTNLNLKKAIDSKEFSGFLFESNKSRQLFERLTESSCFVPGCEEQRSFSSTALLKKHLKEKHNRFLCDICLEHKTCVLKQHKLYSSKALERHMNRGDVDDSGNIVLLHPHCTFCKIVFYDEDLIKKHLGKQHQSCFLCPQKYRYYYYKDYKSLETHFRMTHYLCPDPACQAKGFIAFKTQSDLAAHRVLQHEKNTGQKKAINLNAVAGFYTEGAKLQMEQIKLQDRQGVDFENEFLSLRKTKMRAISDEIDQHRDEEFDLRIFNKHRFEEDQLFEQAFETTKPKDKAGKKKYRLKDEKPKEQEKQQELYMENIMAVKTVHLPPIDYKDFEHKLHIVFSQEQYDKFSELKHTYMKNKISVDEFITSYLSLFSKDNLELAYKIWPQFIRTVQNSDTREELDRAYLKIYKNLPKKNNSLVNSSKKYSDLFAQFQKVVEKALEKRIESGGLNIRKKVRMDKERIFQMIEIIRHVKTAELAHIKFGTNFGLAPETIKVIQNDVITADIEKAHEAMSPLTELELLNLYLYVKFCKNALEGRNIHLQKKLIKEEILEDFLDARPQLVLKYGKRKESMTLEEQAELEQEQEKKTQEKLLNKLAGFQKKVNVIVDNEDKYDFPELGSKKVEQKKEEVNKAKVQLTNEQYKQKFVYESNKQAKLQLNINDYFPTLGSDKPKKQQIKEEAPKEVKKEQGEKPWWTKVEGKKDETPKEGKLPGEIRREKKRNKEKVFLQGGFF